MRNSRLVLLTTEDREGANRVVALLASMGLDVELHEEDSARGILSIRVDPSQADRATALLREEFPGGLPSNAAALDASRMGAAQSAAMPDLWFGPSALVVYLLVALCVAIHLYVHQGSDLVDRARMIKMGAISYGLVEQGESWRLLTAIFLHFNAAHLIANMAVFLFVAPPLAYELGTGSFLLLFVASGLSGNVASHLLAPSAALKAGASGAIAGVIGGLGGYGLRAGTGLRSRPWRIFAAMLAFYGMLIGFGPGRDNIAHMFGLASGILYGWLLQPRAEGGDKGVGRHRATT